MYRNKYLKYKEKYSQLKKINDFLQKGGNFKNFSEISERLTKTPDKVLIYTTQLPNFFNKRVLNFHNSDSITTIKNISDFINIYFINKDFIKIKIDEISSIEQLESNILSIDRNASDKILSDNYKEGEYIFLLRTSSRPGFFSYSFHDGTQIGNVLIKFDDLKIYPYLDSTKTRNKEYMNIFFNLDINKNISLPGMSSLTIKNNLLRTNPELSVEIIFNTDDSIFIKSKFDELTSESLLFVVSHCCSIDNKLEGNFKTYTNQDLTINENKPISIEYLYDLLKDKKDLLIVLWACSGNKYFSVPLMNLLQENIIISRRENIYRLGSLSPELARETIKNFVCGIDSESYITLWNNLQKEHINIPTRYLNITSSYI